MLNPKMRFNSQRELDSVWTSFGVSSPAMATVRFNSQRELDSVWTPYRGHRHGEK